MDWCMESKRLPSSAAAIPQDMYSFLNWMWAGLYSDTPGFSSYTVCDRATRILPISIQFRKVIVVNAVYQLQSRRGQLDCRVRLVVVRPIPKDIKDMFSIIRN